jgi:hypothetical protein
MKATSQSIDLDALPLGCDASGCGFCLDTRDLDAPIDVIEPNLKPTCRRESDQPGCSLGRHGLAAFVVPDVALRAPHAVRKGLLGHAQAFSDGFDGVHDGQ